MRVMIPSAPVNKADARPRLVWTASLLEKSARLQGRGETARVSPDGIVAHEPLVLFPLPNGMARSRLYVAGSCPMFNRTYSYTDV